MPSALERRLVAVRARWQALIRPRSAPGAREKHLVGWVAGLLATVLLAAVAATTLDVRPASAETVLRAGSATLLSVPPRTLTFGDAVPSATGVRAGPDGAVLATRAREVHLAGDAQVLVLDGTHQRLDSGSVIIDARGARGLELSTSSAIIDSAPGAVVRVDDGPLVRVGALAGPSSQVRAQGRRTPTGLPVLYQVQVARDSSPSAPTPLTLRSDTLERELVADLVAANQQLTELAGALGTEATDLEAKQATFRNGQPATAAGAAAPATAAPAAGDVVLAARAADAPEAAAPTGAEARGEAALSYLLATAGRRAGPVTTRLAEVVDLRLAGGSWAVVAALVGVDAGQVGARLAALLAPTAPTLALGGGGDGTGLDLGALLLTPTPAPSAGSDENSQEPVLAGPVPSRRPATGPRPSPQPTPSRPKARPSPTPGPLSPVTDVVDEVVDAVLGVVRPSPSGTASPRPLLPLPSLGPLPLPQPPLPGPLPLPGGIGGF